MPEPTAIARRSAPAAALAALAALGGCGHSQTCQFDERPRADVYAAVVQASRAPRYPDWIVVENRVKADDAAQRVTVFRDLRRDVVEPGLEPRREEKKWRFTAQVSDGTPVAVTFSSPDWSVPSHFWKEADHFFAQVSMRLGEMGPTGPAPGDPLGGAASQGKGPTPPGYVPPKPAPGQLSAP